MIDLFNIALATIVVFTVFGIAAWLWRLWQNEQSAKRERAAKRAAENRARKFRDTAENFGGRIYNKLKRASEHHPGYKDGVRYAMVMKRSNNGGYFTITIAYQEPGVPQHLQATCQIFVPLFESRGNRIRFLEGNYGPTSDFPLSEAGVLALLDRAVPMGKTWGLSKKAA